MKEIFDNGPVACYNESMTNEANKIACMDCRKEIALVKACPTVAKYECKHCGLTQYEFERNGITTWRKQDLSFNGWVHG